VKTVGNDRPPGGRGDEPFPPPRGEETAETEPFPPPRGGTEPGPRPQPERPGPQTSPGSEPDQPPPREATAAEIYVSKVIAGTTLGVFFHELGHAVIGELKLPATGPEEDVADGFSAFVLGSVFEDPENWENAKEEDILQGIVQYSSLLRYYTGQKLEREGRQEGWQGEHAPSLRRFRNSFCIIYGSDPQRFESLADQIQLGARTKARCLQEYTKRYRAWEALLKPVSRNLGPDEPGDHPADAPGGKVLLSFEEPQTDVGRVVTALVRDTDVMKEIADYLQTAFVWPRDLQIEFRNCDQVNAWYDPQAGKVTMCYSIVEHFSKVVFEAESSGGTDTKPDRQPRPDPRPQPAPRRDPQPPRQQEPTVADAMAFFVGTWQATMPTGQGSFTAQVTYAPDRTYRVVLNYPQGPTEVYGTWSAKQLSDRSVQIDAVPTDWSPKQYCNPYGHCQPNYQYASQVVVHLIDQNQVNAEGVVWRRLR